MNLGKVGFILGGGGFSGAYTVGFLKALAAKGIKPKFVQGASVGSLTAAKLMVSGADGAEKKWLDIQKRGQASIFNRRDIFGKVHTSSLFSNKRADELLIRGLDFEKIVNSSIEYQIITAREATKTRAVFSNRDEKIKNNPSLLGKALLASIAMPGFLPPVLINGEWHSDAGIFKIDEAIKAKCDTIFIFINDPLTTEEREEKDFGKLKWYQRFILGLQMYNRFLANGEIKRGVESGYELIQNNPSPIFDDVMPKKLIKKIQRGVKKLATDLKDAATSDIENAFAKNRIVLLTPTNLISSLYTIGFKQPNPKTSYPGDISAAIEQCSTALDENFWKQF